MEATSKRLDYMIQFLDRKLSAPSNSKHTNNGANSAVDDSYNSNRDQSSALPEFMGKGGGTGIFRLPVRGAVHPGRPPCPDVRPHPLRESQIGGFLRTLTTTETQLWTGSDNGDVQVWQFKNFYGGCGDSAPYRESVALGSGVMCMVGDGGSKVVWSGHRDGRVRAKVWSAGYLSLALWDAHTRELLKVFNMDGQIERMDMSLGQDITFEGEIKMKVVAGPKKEKIQSSFGFLQRSCNAIRGAADAVRQLLQKVLDLEGNLLGGWVAQSSPVIKMAVGDGYVFTLAYHGSIRGWSVLSPGPHDNMLRSELAGKEFLYTRIENLKILAGTWNVAQGRASCDSLVSWFCSAAGDVGIVVVGLQEVEMGAGVLAISAAKETTTWHGLFDLDSRLY
ncbi:hypothetical protein GH714_016636 [Hevea brasiliensis]|uniref:IP5PC-F beta-propeller domain-containing protein n=1 Tax=Hevea brasiliensis TaxID=3981 RepID=A0A6A6KE26_HEVBR|nr:hypothetical protein GH714_016636 [Hevea brasiliensis]